MDLEKIEKIYCKCRKYVGDAALDYQVLLIGNLECWSPTRFLCRNCGKSIVWQPKNPPDTQTDEEFAVEKLYRNSLGNKRVVGRPPRVADRLKD